MNLLLNSLEWDCPEVLARSLPAKILILNGPAEPSNSWIADTVLRNIGVKPMGFMVFNANTQWAGATGSYSPIQATIINGAV